MYSSSLPKKFKVPGQAPTAAELTQGELIINSADAKLYTKDFNGVVQLIATPAVQQIDIIDTLDLTAWASLSTDIGNLIVGAGGSWVSLIPAADGNMLLTDSTQIAGVRWGKFASVVAAAPEVVAFTTQGAAGQTANILQVTDSTGVILAAVDPNGWMLLGSGAATGSTVLTINSTGSASLGEYVQIAHDAVSTQSINKYTYYGRIYPTVATGYTEYGGSNGVHVDVLRQGTAAGTLTTIVGMQANYGHQLAGSSSGVTVYNYGLKLQPYNQYGVIQTQYDLFIATPLDNGTPGTIAQHYGIYQQDATAQNYLAGMLNIGTQAVQAGLVVGTSNTTQVYVDYAYQVMTAQSVANCGLQIDLAKNFSGGAADYGYLRGQLSNVLITGTGSLATLAGYECNYGANLAATGALTTVYGIHLNPQTTNCSVSNLYDLYISAPTGGGSVAGHYAIYQADTTATNYLAGILAVGGTASAPLLSVDAAGHVVSAAGTPAVTAAAGAGTGTGLAVTVSGSDQGGLVTVTTGGTAPTASASVVTVTFGTAFAYKPKAIVITPANAAAAALMGVAGVYVNSANTTAAYFTLDVGSTGLTTSTTYEWYYLVIG